MQLSFHLSFKGQCEEAFKFYEQTIGGKITFMMTHGDSPMANEFPPEWRNKIMHASMTVADMVLMGSDSPPSHQETVSGFAIAINVKAPAEATQIFDALAKGGTVRMPLQQTFWASSFGMLVDRFGIPWMINCEQSA